MAGTATLSATESAIVSTTKLNVLLHTSCSNPFSAKLSFPYRSHKIGICHRSKPSNSTSEGAQEIIDDEAFFFDGDGLAEDDETDEEDDDAESSIDLLLRFLQSMFKKISKRAKKATRSVLPAAIPTQLVVCTLGGTVFSVILLLRVIWASLSYFQSSGSIFNQSGSSFGTTQPIT
ncbi:protein SHORT HYPOCOTYL IN WHITE LIGHT 1 isoform X2 [Ziziphus jujuba]|uniref:Protein SHORT HYPOCOTYL IN WHITE LIGHT 1 isoform X2 n=1 Tax=Ziziphus jujuba TaxID=326968 RepID=A0ABM3I277_ZIZJJ|nr:protein SHORT HYPOCOTYL IN WHITE LIGHT 1 isoform X2 [Ziziphus jujuba]